MLEQLYSAQHTIQHSTAQVKIQYRLASQYYGLPARSVTNNYVSLFIWSENKEEYVKWNK